ncbi:hypothetical protein Tco_0784533 [Tanacetum coccineum]
MTTLAEHMIVAGAENRPPMLDKSMYDSWKSCMLIYKKGKKNGRMMLESIENGPLVYPTIEENGAIRPKKYAELIEQEQLQDDCDVQATNIVLQGLPPDVYSLVNHCKTVKDIWARVKLLMQGTEVSYQERECKLYNEFDKFTSVKGESLYEYCLRFAQLINDMHIIGMTMQQVQLNTKFLNALQPEWSKFVTNVKLVKNLYTTNYDQLYAYLSQHERHANEVRLLSERYQDPIALLHHVLCLPITNSDHLPIQETRLPLRIAGLLFNKFKEDMVKVLLVQELREMLQVQGKTMQLVKQGLLSVIIVRVQEAGQELDEEQLAFLADPGIPDR